MHTDHGPSPSPCAPLVVTDLLLGRGRVSRLFVLRTQCICLVIFSHTKKFNDERFGHNAGLLAWRLLQLLDDASFGGATPTLEKILAFLAHFGPFLALFEPLLDLPPP